MIIDNAREAEITIVKYFILNSTIEIELSTLDIGILELAQLELEDGATAP